MDVSKALDFLRQLKANNNREWFAAHKDTYLQISKEVNDFAELFRCHSVALLRRFLLFRHLPFNDVLLLARKVDTHFDEFPAVHLETSGVVLLVDLVECCLSVAVHLELK